MNITRSNWGQMLPFIRQTLKKSDYVAIDFEMSGILASNLLRNSLLDSLQTRYWKTKENVKRFLPLQIGICGFQVIDGKQIVAYPFNIYLYPFTGHESLEKNFLFASGAIQFLAEHNFDFNQTFYDGVHFLSKENQLVLEESKKLNAIKENLRKINRAISPDMIAFVQQNITQIALFFASPIQNTFTVDIKFTKVRNYTYLIDLLPSICNGQKYHIVYDIETFYNRSKMIITKGEAPISNDLVLAKVDESIDPIGVRQLIEQIIDQRTPLLLHNGLTDLCHIYDKFLYSLPEKQEEFKLAITKHFPVIYDTKYMVNSTNLLFNQVKQFSELKNCYVCLQQYQNHFPVIKIDEDFKEYQLFPEKTDDQKNQTPNNIFEHEAGFDALMTGYIFFKAAAIIQNGTQQNLECQINHERLQFFKNRMPLGSVRYPFFFNDIDDNYHEKGMQIFYLSQVQKSLIDPSVIRNYFESNNIGTVNLFLSYGRNFEYFMTFQQQASVIPFIEKLKEGSTIIEIDGKSIIISLYENYQDQLRRQVKDDIEISKMSNVLEKPENIKEDEVVKGQQ